jgi:hypothetical protein
MKIKEQIEILEALIDAAEELGEFQEGWTCDVKRGEEMLEHLRNMEMVSTINRSFPKP